MIDCIHFNVCFRACMGWPVSFESVLKVLPLAQSMLSSFCFKSLLITSFHVLLGLPPGKVPLIVEGSTFTRPITLFHSF